MAKIWVFVEPANGSPYQEVEYSRVPCVGEYVTLPDSDKFFRVDMVAHPGSPMKMNDGEIFVTEVNYMEERRKAFPKG